MSNCYVFHMGLIKLGLDCMLPFLNPAIKQTNNNKKKRMKLSLLWFIYMLWGGGNVLEMRGKVKVTQCMAM